MGNLSLVTSDSARAPQSKQPILAINYGGKVVRANFPARKALTRGEAEPEGQDLGTLLAEALEPSNRDNVTLSMHDAHGRPIEVRIVLSNYEAAGVPTAVSAQPAHPAPEVRLIDFVAHELRNPMGTVLGLARVLESRGDMLSKTDRTGAVHSIQEETERALLILNGLLKLAEGRAGRVTLSERVPLCTVLNRIVVNHRRQNPHRDLRVFGEAPLFVQGNSLWIELAVANLLSNAEKYTPRDGEITVGCYQNGNTAAIVVLDRGDSLPAERYPTLWDLYERGAAGQALEVSGSGIGLALCKELVEEMGGKVWAGPREGGGSVFALKLPAPWERMVPDPLGTRMSMEYGEEGEIERPLVTAAAA